MSAVLEMPIEEMEDEMASQPDAVTRLRSSQRTLDGFAQILRIVGALSIVGSMSVFLLQGWSVGNDVQRYLLLLVQTVLLTGAGFILSHVLKETKGARVFFGLALVSIPANFTILGALLYSAFQLDGALTQYPTFANWQLVDLSSASFTLLGALLVLIPLSLLCFAIMARRSARSLALHFLLLNSLLLVPVRSASTVGVMALGAVIYALWVSARQSRRDGALATLEGKFALGVLFAPTVIIIVRSLNFYPVNSVLLASLAVAVFALLRHVSQGPDRAAVVRVVLETLSLPVAFTAAVFVAASVGGVAAGYGISPLFAVTLALLGGDVVRRTRSPFLAQFGGLVISACIAASLALNLFVLDSLGAALACLIAGSALCFAGYVARQKAVVIVGVVLAATGLIVGAQDLVAVIVEGGWIELAVLGAVIIAAASVVDRYGLALRARTGRWLETARGRLIGEPSSPALDP